MAGQRLERRGPTDARDDTAHHAFLVVVGCRHPIRAEHQVDETDWIALLLEWNREPGPFSAQLPRRHWRYF